MVKVGARDENLLSYTIYNLLKSFDADKRGFMPLARFYKASYLVHKKLKKEYDLNIGLPWYWFKFGPCVEMEYCPDSVWEIGQRDDNRKIFYRDEPPYLDNNSEKYELILETIKPLKYHETDKLTKLAYEDLSNSFLTNFLELERIFFKYRPDIESIKDKICDLMNKISIDFPVDDYNSFYVLFLRFEDVFQILCENNINYLKSHMNLVERFREIVVTNASLLHHENLPRIWEEKKENELDNHIRNFKEEFVNIEQEIFLNIYRPKDKSNKHLRKLFEISHSIAKEE